MGKILSALGRFVIGLVKFIRDVSYISYLFVIAVFLLGVFMPENLQKVLEIFKNLF
jgi:hypothetical protein